MFAPRAIVTKIDDVAKNFDCTTQKAKEFGLKFNKPNATWIEIRYSEQFWRDGLIFNSGPSVMVVSSWCRMIVEPVRKYVSKIFLRESQKTPSPQSVNQVVCDIEMITCIHAE